MRGSRSIWSAYVNCLFGDIRKSMRRRSPLRRRYDSPSCIAAEVLEERALMSATLGAAASFGNDAGTTRAIDVAADAAGNSFVTGLFSGTVDFDPGATHAGDTDILTSRGAQDSYVAKFGPDNSLVWVRRMGGDDTTINGAESGEKGNKIAVDAGGNVYAAGGFVGSADFGATTLTSNGDVNGYVVKLDAGGTFQWARSWGTNHASGTGVGVDSSGNVYAAGTRLTTNIDTNGNDFLKYNSSGNLLWSRSIATHSPSFGDLAVDGPGNLYFVDSFSGTVDFDPSPKLAKVSSPGTSAFVLKLTTDGKFGWVAPFVGQTVGSTTGSAMGSSVALDGSGNVIVGGNYNNTVDFDPGKGVTTLSTATGGGFVVKLSSSGGLAWARGIAWEAGAGGLIKGLAADSSGSIYATGAFGGTVDFDPGAGVQAHTASGGSDIFVTKLTSAGNFSSVETLGGVGDDRGSAIAVDPTGTIHLVGYFQDTVDFDPDPFATYYLTGPVPGDPTYYDAFLLLLRQV